MFWELIYNASLLLSLGVLYFFVSRRWPHTNITGQFLQGLLFGTIALAVMSLPLVIRPGLYVDARTVVLSVAGLFAGPLAACIAVVITGTQRFLAGGTGQVVGLLNIIISAGIGVVFHYWKRRNPNLTRPIMLYLFGMLVQVATLPCILILPLPLAWEVSRIITIPLLILNPLVTLLLGMLLVEGEKRIMMTAGLEKSEKRFRTLAENVPGVVYRCQVGPPYSADYMSEDIQELTGYPLAHFTTNGQRSLNQLVTPHDREQVITQVREAVRLRKPFDLEYRIQHADGSLRWVYDRGQAFYSEDGEPQWLDGVVLDITAAKRAEEELRQAKEMAENYLRMAGTILLSLDREGKIILLNKKGYEILGYQEGELRGLDWFDVCLPPAWTQQVRTSLLAAMRGKKELDEYYENPVITKSGQERTIAWHNALLRDRQGRVYALLSSGEDITDRRLAEENLKRISGELDRFFTLAQDMLCIADASGVLRRVNQEWTRTLGYSLEELQGHSIKEFTHPEDIPATDKALKRLGEQRPILGYVNRCLDKQGGTKWLEWRAVAMGEVVFASARDITQRIMDEEERDRLEHQLRQSQKLEAIGTLAGGVAHDFNNVLSAIMGYTELAQLGLASGEKPARELDNVMAAAARARDLVRQILSFSRQSGRKLQPLELRPLINEALHMIRASIPTTIDIEENLGARGMRVLADPVQIHQVLMNLCTNAYQALEESGGVIKLSLDAVKVGDGTQEEYLGLKQGEYLLLTVIDNGPGMDPGILDRIFEPFFTTKEAGKGTGMGLSVAHGIITAHKGAIKVESSLGQGSKFMVYLPVFTGKEESQPAQTPSSPPRGKGRILLVDDEDTLVDVGRNALEHLGYQVIGTTSAKEALQLFKDDPESFGLVITDFTMPEMTGFKLAEQLLAVRPEVPIILCTGYREQITTEQSRRQGISQLLIKPINLAQLGRAVDQALHPDPK
ncbi:MAG: PAS domain S-box protein [Deltaproteobacteria bacterium]|nr:PAS domain S-box protein [Deltaproteobacteria bacterium]